MTEASFNLNIYRPVHNLEQSHYDKLQEFAQERQLKVHIAGSLFRFDILRAGDVHKFYQRTEASVDYDDIQGLSEYCYDCGPNGANQEITVPTFPAEVQQQKVRSSAGGQWRFYETAFLGANQKAKEERDSFRSVVANYGDKYGPLEDRWPDDFPVGVRAILGKRTATEKSDLRTTVRKLTKAGILPELLELGGVKIDLQIEEPAMSLQ